jgi:adenosyl cobinamide kinase/adenosyl cobinamide phosphate guanylyltransferase
VSAVPSAPSGLGLIVGGARSGKSRAAVALAGRTGRPVVFVATAEARDDEMADRIGRHRAERPAGWVTVEEPLSLAAALGAAAAGACVIVDCLSLWVANLMEAGWDAPRIEREAASAATVAAGRGAPTVAVTNEVGMSIVPDNALARAYRDVLGRVNAEWAAAAGWTVLAVAGRLVELAGHDEVLGGLAGRIDRG